MNSIYLVRHGDYENPRNILPGRLPLPLSDLGKEQAQKLQKFFSDKNIKTIYSSAVQRCKETAEIIANKKIPIIYDKRLLETHSAYQGYWGENWHGSGFHFFSHYGDLGGESLEDIRERVGNWWDEISKQVKGNIIVCGHGDPLATLYSYIKKLPQYQANAKESQIPGWIEKGEYLEILNK